MFLVNNSLSGRWLFLALRLTIVSLDHVIVVVLGVVPVAMLESAVFVFNCNSNTVDLLYHIN